METSEFDPTPDRRPEEPLPGFVPIEPRSRRHRPGEVLARGRLDLSAVPPSEGAPTEGDEEAEASPAERSGGESSAEVREVVLRAVRSKPTWDEPSRGSVGAPWNAVGYELWVPRKGRQPERRLVERLFATEAEAIVALAQDPRVPSRALRSDRAQILRERLEKAGPLLGPPETWAPSRAPSVPLANPTAFAAGSAPQVDDQEDAEPEE